MVVTAVSHLSLVTLVCRKLGPQLWWMIHYCYHLALFNYIHVWGLVSYSSKHINHGKL